jgi:hypothetical protein
MTAWFRAYSETLNDPKVQTLPLDAFKAWHNAMYLASFISSGDGNIGTPEAIAFHFRMTPTEVVQVMEPLVLSGLIERKKREYVIAKWSNRQFKADSGDVEEGFYVYFIGPKNMATIKIGHSKNPWARLSNLQSGSPTKNYVLATIRTTESGDRWLAEHFRELKINGEWFSPNHKMTSLIKALSDKKLKGRKDVENYLANYVGTTVAATTDTDTDIQLSKDNCGEPEIVDAKKLFFDKSKAYLSSVGVAKPGALVNKWLRDHGKDLTVAAINAAQLENPLDPIAYIGGYFKRQGTRRDEQEDIAAYNARVLC